VPGFKFTKTAKRELASLPTPVAKEIGATIRVFADRKLANADVKKLHGRKPPEYRLRVGNYRIIYRLEDSTIVVTHVADRKEAYR
jgi:mRNA interferase RelE/StbE